MRRILSIPETVEKRKTKVMRGGPGMDAQRLRSSPLPLKPAPSCHSSLLGAVPFSSATRELSSSPVVARFDLESHIHQERCNSTLSQISREDSAIFRANINPFD